MRLFERPLHQAAALDEVWGLGLQWVASDLATSAGFRQGITSLIAQAWSLKPNIPFWATEFGTRQWTWHGKYWTQYPHVTNSYSDTKPYWARAIANMLNAFNAGLPPLSPSCLRPCKSVRVLFFATGGLLREELSRGSI